MTGNFYLDWAVLAVSLFNTILLLWLGLTVFLNAEVRVWGIWLAAAGLLSGAIFFISHSAILGHGLSPVTPGLNFWWRIGWIPIAALPLAWYVVMLWYSGFWEPREGLSLVRNRLHQRHTPGFYLATLAGLLLVGFLLISNPLPSFSQLATNTLVATPSLGGIPLLVLVYPLYTLLCIGLALDALRNPAPSGRIMGDMARSRARPWLSATSLILLMVSILVGWVMVWIVRNVPLGILSGELLFIVGWFDFVIESLIAIAILLLGQAVVTYEVFTGKTLPRRGLSNYWRRAVILAAGYGLILAWGLTLQLRPIYSLLLSMLLMVIFYALLGWRAYAERERYIQSLRPFVAQHRLYAGILAGENDQPDVGLEDVHQPFHALCADILETRQACLIPLGVLAPLSGASLVYPAGSEFLLPDLGAVIARLESPAEIGIPLAPGRRDGMVFAVPLWSERGLIGVLLLGEKISGGLYAQEEIEIARAVGEHLIDTKASLEMARRLVNLQRQRMVQSQVLDQQARRVLHDEVLPLVHTALLNLAGQEGTGGQPLSETTSLLEEVHRQLSNLLRASPGTGAVEVRRLGLVGALRQIVEVELHGAFDAVTWEVQPQAETELDGIPALVAEVLFFAAREVARNAARHGRQPENGTRLDLTIGVKYQNGLLITIEDNGPGFTIDQDAPYADKGSFKGMYNAGNPVDTAETWDGARPMEGANGHGLAIHSTMMAVIGGYLTVESAAGQYTRVTLELPEAAWRSWQ